MASVWEMFLATVDPHLLIIIVLLLVSGYMFAALKYPALRFIFRLKRFAARALGVDAAANRRLSEKLGLFLCPLIGVGALMAAGWVALEWNASHVRRIQAAKEAADWYQALCADVSKMLNEGEITDICFDTRPKLNPSPEGHRQIEDFLRKLGSRPGAEILPKPLDPASEERGALTVVFKSDGVSASRRVVSMFPEQDQFGIRNQYGNHLARIPAELRQAWIDLGNLERIDLVEIENEKARTKSEIEKRLSSYKLQTFAGTPAWQIHDLADSPQQNEREQKAKEFVGMEFDWECRLSKVEEMDGKLHVAALQHSPKSGGAWPIHFTAEKSQLPDGINDPRLVFVRIHGFIESMDKGIRVKVDKLERFKPMVGSHHERPR